MVVRVEVLIDGEPPRDDAVRYYRMSYSAVTGWRTRHEVHAWTFYTKLWQPEADGRLHSAASSPDVYCFRARGGACIHGL